MTTNTVFTNYNDIVALKKKVQAGAREYVMKAIETLLNSKGFQLTVNHDGDYWQIYDLLHLSGFKARFEVRQGRMNNINWWITFKENGGGLPFRQQVYGQFRSSSGFEIFLNQFDKVINNANNTPDHL